MLLLVLRHAEAEVAVTSDAARILTPRGVEQATLVGEYCGGHHLRPDLILTSPYKRTVQTGELVASVLPGVPTQAAPFLASGMEPKHGLSGLSAYSSHACLMIVGHQPDLGLLTATLLGEKQAPPLPFKLATLAALHVERFASGGGSLELFVAFSRLRAERHGIGPA